MEKERGKGTDTSQTDKVFTRKEYIERKEFKAEIRRISTHYLNEWDTLGVLAAADRIPAADVVPVRHGRWIKYAPHNSDMMTCSECEKYWILDGDQYDYHYCPNCGALMDKGGDGE